MLHKFVFTQNVPLFLSFVLLVLFVLPVKDLIAFTSLFTSNKVSLCLSVIIYLSFSSLICQVPGLLLFVVYVFSLHLSWVSSSCLRLCLGSCWQSGRFGLSLSFVMLKVCFRVCSCSCWKSGLWSGVFCLTVFSVCLSVCSWSDLVKSQVLCLRLQSLICCLSLHQVLVYSHYHTWLLCSSK